MKTKYFLFICLLIWSLFSTVSCSNKDKFYDGEYNPEVIRNYKNSNAQLNSKMDSLEAINYIVKRKLSEVYELSCLASQEKNDSIIEDILLYQLSSYFDKKDTIQASDLLKEMIDLDVYYTDISNFHDLKRDSIMPDSIGKMVYTVDYFSKDKKLIKSAPQTAIFILKNEPKKFQKEFKFYFQYLKYEPAPNDTIPAGVSR